MINRVLVGIGTFIAVYLGIMVIPLAAVYLVMAVFTFFSELSLANLPGLKDFLLEARGVTALFTALGFVVSTACGMSVASK